MTVKKCKIIPRILGGLGNQLFIYAAARRLALVNNADLAIDHLTGFTYDLQYKRHYQLDNFNISCPKATAVERLEPLSRARRYLIRRWNQYRRFEQRTYIMQVSKGFDPRLLTLRPKGTIYLEGYWQSEGYFKDIELQLREDLRIIPPSDNQNRQMAQYIRQMPAIAVHVRFFDERKIITGAKYPTSHVLVDYYQRAISVMERLVPGAHYFVFTDRPQDVCARLPMVDGRMTLVHHNQGDSMAYADLWLMTQCQYFIIANSTFSWWGAWLANNPTKLVIAPKFDIQDGKLSWGFKGQLPGEWIKI